MPIADSPNLPQGEKTMNNMGNSNSLTALEIAQIVTLLEELAERISYVECDPNDDFMINIYNNKLKLIQELIDRLHNQRIQ